MYDITGYELYNIIACRNVRYVHKLCRSRDFGKADFCAFVYSYAHNEYQMLAYRRTN